MSVLLVLIPIITVTVSTVIAVKKRISGTPAKKAFRYNAISFLIVLVLLVVFAVGSFAASTDSAEPDAAPATSASEQADNAEPAKTDEGFSKGMAYLAAGLSTGLAGIGGGIAVAAGAPAAIGAVSEDPAAFGKAIIFVALGESIALYGVVISILVLPS